MIIIFLRTDKSNQTSTLARQTQSSTYTFFFVAWFQTVFEHRSEKHREPEIPYSISLSPAINIVTRCWELDMKIKILQWHNPQESQFKKHWVLLATRWQCGVLQTTPKDNCDTARMQQWFFLSNVFGWAYESTSTYPVSVHACVCICLCLCLNVCLSKYVCVFTIYSICPSIYVPLPPQCLCCGSPLGCCYHC